MTDYTSLKGKRAIVTGASGGIGQAIAERLAREGVDLALTYRGDERSALEAAAQIERSGGRAITVQGDVAKPGDAAAIADAACDAFGGIDILVNNAGISTYGMIADLAPEAIERELAVNVMGVVLMTQATLPKMSDGGAIVNISSNIAYAPMPGMSLYCATKAAVSCLTQGMAREFGERRIRVNAAAPGATHTPMTETVDAEILEAIARDTPLGRIAEPADIADLVCFLSSDQARWVNGRTIIADGGLV